MPADSVPVGFAYGIEQPTSVQFELVLRVAEPGPEGVGGYRTWLTYGAGEGRYAGGRQVRSLEATAKALRALRGLGWIETGRRTIAVHDLDAMRARSA